MAELGLPYRPIVSGILPNVATAVRSALLGMMQSRGNIPKGAPMYGLQDTGTEDGGGSQKADGPTDRIGQQRSPEWQAHNLQSASTDRPENNRDCYNRDQHFRQTPLPAHDEGSDQDMAKIGRACAQSASLASVGCCHMLAFVAALTLPFPAEAEVRSSDLTWAVLQPGDFCVGKSGGDRTFSAPDVVDDRTASRPVGLVDAEYVQTPSPERVADLPVDDKARAASAGVSSTEKATAHTGPHADNPAMAREHAAMLALVPPAVATAVAINDGSWFAPSTWQSGEVPGVAAKVLIPSNVTVTYDGQSNEPLFTLRIDGTLQFATDRNSRLVIDTMVVSPEGRLEIGTATHPVQPQVQAEILITGTGDIDLAWDPMLLSRGVVSHGSAEIHGASKTSFLKTAKTPLRGDIELVLSSAPEGWRVGDRLVVTGTVKRGWAWDNAIRKVRHHPSQDEVVKIVSLDGPRVTIDRPLLFNHDSPRADLAAYVANTTRNILFASLAGAGTPLPQRGHVMFMHSDRVDVRYAAFDHLGRTDKSHEAFDLSALNAVLPTSNIKGRYSLHLHKTGMANPAAPAMVVGNVVFGSPGWGFVHHSSNADFVDNVAFDVFGAAYAAEDGDETGIWLRNIAIRAQGFDAGEAATKLGVERHDNGRTGDGFFFAGRLVEAAENVAANTTHGFVWMHRSAPSSPASETIDQPAIAYGRPVITPDDPPIQGFRDNEAFGTKVGLIVIKGNSEQGHDIRSVLDGFLNWETGIGVDISYTGHYTLLDFDLIGARDQEFFAADTGVRYGTNAFDIVINRLTLARFAIGVNMAQEHTYPLQDAEVGLVLIDVEAEDVVELFRSPSKTRYKLLTAADLATGVLEVVRRPVELHDNEDLPLWADKRDSIGQTVRQKPGDQQTIYRWEVPDLLHATGYFTGPDGQKVALIPDFMADRATGALVEQSFVVKLDIPDFRLASWGATDRGVYDPKKSPPVAVDDTVETVIDQPKVIKPLQNDTDPEGTILTIQGTTDPRYGDLVVMTESRLLYRPNLGYIGPDEFTYWASDGMGNYAPATVRIVIASP